MITLVLGGARSGKSRHAEALIGAEPAPWLYVATAQAFDDEMQVRIAEHQRRRGEGWRTMEAPLDLAVALEGGPRAAPLLVDCLTLWVSNLILASRDVPAACDAMLDALTRREGPTVLVSNETGLGIVPDNALARRFRDEAGLVNQRVAATADRVVMMVAGLPLTLKPA